MTSHYTPYDFVFKNLWQQFHRAANVYFLVVGCLQLDAFFPGLSPTHWSTTLGPLVFVLGINAAKEAFDDAGRHRSDAAVNKRPALTIVTKRVPSEQVPSADDDFARDDARTRDAESGNGSEKNEDDENDETRERER